MEEQELQLLEESKNHVSSIGKWQKFFAILSVIGIAFLVVTAICLFAFGTLIDDMAESPMSFKWVGLIYLILAGIVLIPTIYLFRASAAAEVAVDSNDNMQVVEFLKNNKSYWKFYGIYTIVCMALCLLVIPLVIIGAAIAI